MAKKMGFFYPSWGPGGEKNPKKFPQEKKKFWENFHSTPKNQKKTYNGAISLCGGQKNSQTPEKLIFFGAKFP